MVRSSAQDMITVQLCVRKPGVAGAQNPHGEVKLELRQPRSMRRTWEEARQFSSTKLPNLNVVWDGQVIKIRQAGDIAASSEGLADLGDVHELAARREALGLDIARQQALLDQLSDLHIRVRNQYAAEEVRLQASIAATQKLLDDLRAAHACEQELVHEKTKHLLQAEASIADLTKQHVQKYEKDMRSAVSHEAEVANETHRLVAEQLAKGEGTLPERLVTRAINGATDFVGTPMGSKIVEGVLRKFGVVV